MNRKPIATLVSLTIPGMVGLSTVQAETLTASIQIPRLDVAEYHRPYVAAWIESEERALVANLAVWYDIEMRDREGETWLKDLRQWWRKGGRQMELPVDGVSGPTRPVGEHEFSVDLTKTDLPRHGDGTYYFVVEASREVGGRELLRIPFNWSAATSLQESIHGERELGKITLSIGK